MTRKDWEKIAKIMKEMKTAEAEYWTGGACPAPSAEWMRRRIIRALCVEFGMKKEQDDAFCKSAGMPITQERTFK